MVAQAQSRPSGQTRLVPKTGKQFYGSWKEREQHMAIYKEVDGKAGKCCDVGGGCSWTGCNHSRLSDADYRAWKTRQKKSDEKHKGKGRNSSDVGPYRWAVCSKCVSQSRAKGIHITMRDGFVWRCLRNNKDTINVVEGRTVDESKKEDSVAVVFADGESAPDQATAPAPAPVQPRPSAAKQDEAVLQMDTELKAQRDAYMKEIEASKQQLSLHRLEAENARLQAENARLGSYGGHAETFTQADGRQTRVVDVNLGGRH